MRSQLVRAATATAGHGARNETFTEIGFALSPGAGYIGNYSWMEGWNLPGGQSEQMRGKEVGSAPNSPPS